MGTVEEEFDEMLMDAGAVKAALVAELMDEGDQILSIVVASIRTAQRGGR